MLQQGGVLTDGAAEWHAGRWAELGLSLSLILSLSLS